MDESTPSLELLESALDSVQSSHAEFDSIVQGTQYDTLRTESEAYVRDAGLDRVKEPCMYINGRQLPINDQVGRRLFAVLLFGKGQERTFMLCQSACFLPVNHFCMLVVCVLCVKAVYVRDAGLDRVKEPCMYINVRQLPIRWRLFAVLLCGAGWILHNAA